MDRTCLWNLLHGIQEKMAKLAAGTDLFWMIETKLGASEKNELANKICFVKLQNCVCACGGAFNMHLCCLSLNYHGPVTKRIWWVVRSVNRCENISSGQNMAQHGQNWKWDGSNYWEREISRENQMPWLSCCIKVPQTCTWHEALCTLSQGIPWKQWRDRKKGSGEPRYGWKNAL